MSEQVKREAISAFDAGKQLGDNPYPSSTKEASVWSATWTAEKLKSRRRVQNQAFQTGAARAEAAIQNKAASVGVRMGNSATIKAIVYQEAGREVVKPVKDDAEANALTKELDKRGVEWMAQYSSGWK